MVSVLDLDGRLRLHFGPRVLGYDEGEKVGTRVWELLHPDDLERAADAFGELLTRPGLGPRPIELRVRHTDGSWRWLEVLASNLMENPDVQGVVLNSHDVTERKFLEQALDDTHEELEASQVLARLGTWRVVDEGNNRAWSRSMYELVGCDPSQPAPSEAAFLSLVHPDDRAAMADEIRRVRSGEPRFAKFRIVDQTGGERWISSWASPLRDGDGSIVGVRGVANDLTSGSRSPV
jgi:PAS domain S-box-containing protein